MTRKPTVVVFLAPAMVLGGAERQMYLLIRHLDRARFTPILVTLNGKGEFFERAQREGVECHHLGVTGKFPLTGFVRLVGLMRDTSARVLVMRGFNATVLGRLAALLAGVRVRVIAEHATGWVQEPSAFRRVVDRMLMPVTSAWVSISQVQEEFLVQDKGIPSSRLHLVPNGIEPVVGGAAARAAGRAAMSLSEDEFVVGIVAVLRPEKDHATFVAAAKEFVAGGHEGRFVIVGDGPERDRVERAIEMAGMAEAVQLLGARTDVERLLPALDVFTLSSYTIETSPMAVLEAMSCGVPIVATRVGGIPEMVADGVEGVLVRPKAPKELAEAWAALAESPSKRLEMGQACASRVERSFTADAMARGYEELFDRLLDVQRAAS